MTVDEFSNQFDVLFNNITSNQAPGLNEYEKSVFLTKAQDEIVKNYFNPKSNPKQDGFDDTPKRQIDFSVLTTVNTIYKETEYESEDDYVMPDIAFMHPLFDPRDYIAITRQIPETPSDTTHWLVTYTTGTSVSVKLPEDVMMIINERIEVSRNGSSSSTLLSVRPIDFAEYDRLMSKPFKRPINYQAWRLINNDESNKADLVVGPADDIISYSIRYIRRPHPIIIGELDGLTLENFEYGDYDATTDPKKCKGCELDEMLHEEILQRAVELAKIAWTGDAQSVITAGARSE